MTAYALLALLILAGCERVELDGPDAQGYKWQKDGPVGAPIYHYGVDVYLNCNFAAHAQACSIFRDGECHIYLPQEYPPWMKAHEERHCAGWRHPDWTRGA